MRLIDVHSHLEYGKLYGRIDDVVKNASRAGVIKIITNTILPEKWERSLEISGRFDEVESALGIHPWYLKPEHYPSLDDLPDYLKRGAIAVGEIGLDRENRAADYELQKKFFIKQLGIARELSLPVILHCRGAFDELAAIIKNEGLPEPGGVIHAFSGSKETAAMMIKCGLSFSIGGSVTYRLSRKRIDGLKFIYPRHLLLETDSPDFVPIGVEAEYNEPANIGHNLKALSIVLETDPEEVAETTTVNAAQIFRFKFPE